MSNPSNVTNYISSPNCLINFRNPQNQLQSFLFQLPEELPPLIFQKVVSGGSYSDAEDSARLGRVCTVIHRWLHPAFVRTILCSPSLCSHVDRIVHDRSEMILSPILEVMDDVASDLYSCLLITRRVMEFVNLQENSKKRTEQCIKEARKEVPFLVGNKNKRFLYPVFIQMLNTKPINEFKEVLELADLCATIFLSNKMGRQFFNDDVLSHLSKHFEDYNF